MTVKHFLMNHGMVENSQLPYPPCFMPANFFIFPKAKTTPKGRFQDVEDIKNNVSTALNAVPLDASDDCANCRKMQEVCCTLKENKIILFLLYVYFTVPELYCLTMWV
jgi:hypothetical protein